MLTFLNRIDDESALRAKVDEAMTVYDEYVKTKSDDEPAAAAVPAPEESKKESEKESEKEPVEENKS